MGGQIRVALAKMGTGPETRVVVKLQNGRSAKGYLKEVHPYSFVITDPETHVSTQVAYSNVKQLNALSHGARIAITVGVIGAIAIWLICYGVGGCGGFS